MKKIRIGVVGVATEATSIIAINSSRDLAGVAWNLVAIVRFVMESTSYTAVNSADGLSAYSRA